MKKRWFIIFPFMICIIATVANASFEFHDDRFSGIFTTENLDAIIDEYDLYPGWYWTTPPRITQDFHGNENSPGWTDTAVNKLHRNQYKSNFYGCRWYSNQVLEICPDKGGYGECFGFAQFIGYLLSGDYNAHKNWDFYYSIDKVPEGLKVGDIFRTEFKVNNALYRHSAIVYSVNDNEILFFQVSGSNYNLISISGFSDGYHQDVRNIEDLSKIPNIKICRSGLNK